MAVNEQSFLSRIFGPYESWLFGPETLKFSGDAGKLDDGDYVVALAEVSPIDDVGDPSKELPKIDNILTPIRPHLWGPMVTNARQGLLKSLFVPLVLRNDGDPGRSINGSLFSTAIAKFLLGDTDVTKHQMSTMSQGRQGFGIANYSMHYQFDLKPQYGVRLNSKLQRHTVDEAFAKNPKRPVMQIDKGLPPDSGEGIWPFALVAVIDDGIAFGHPSLLDRSGNSRVECCWLQAAPHQKKNGTVLFGREHLRHEIDAMRTRHKGDEDALYREAGAVGDSQGAHPLEGRISHGAYVLNLAAGRRSDDDPELLDRIRIIGVELPSPLTMDTVGFGKDALILSAFHYIFDRADLIADAYRKAGFKIDTPIPLFINFSFGFTGGPHDGTDRLEQAIKDLIYARGTRWTELVLPAGNQFQSRLHGVIEQNDGDPDTGHFSIPWRIQPDDRTSNYLEIWFPPEVKEIPSLLEVYAPDGTRAYPSPGGQRLSEEKSTAPIIHKSNVIGQAGADQFRGGRWRQTVILAPTDPAGATWAGTPAGVWRIIVNAKMAGESRIECRIQRDQTVPHRHHYGRQSYFDASQEAYWDERGIPKATDTPKHFIQRYGTLNGLATNGAAEVVAGYRRSAASGSYLAASYSSAGYVSITPDAPGSVTCAAMSDEAPSLPGVKAAGTRAGSTGRLSGTSAAAPQVVRDHVLMRLKRMTTPTVNNSSAATTDLPAPHVPTTRPTSTIRLGKRLY